MNTKWILNWKSILCSVKSFFESKFWRLLKSLQQISTQIETNLDIHSSQINQAALEPKNGLLDRKADPSKSFKGFFA